MKISPIGAKLICASEGYRDKAYLCEAGVWTIGYGTTVYPNGNPVKKGDICTMPQALEWFYNDITPKEKVLNNKVSVPLTQNEYDALLSLMYNIGEPRFLTSTLLKLLNQNKKDLAAKEFLKWNKVKGKVSSGLSKRRMSEMALFLAKNTQ